MRRNAALSVGVVCLALVSISILVFGLVALAAPGTNDPGLMRADGLASVGTALFGLLITLVPYRRTERWAWWALWFYPVFWAIHLAADLPPGKDHIHQILGIVIALAGLLVPARVFFASTRSASA